MPRVRDKEQQREEPIGIVISSGSRDETEPRFSAYVWGPAPAPQRHAKPKAA